MADPPPVLRLVTDDEMAPLDREAVMAEIHERWTEARNAYNQLIGTVGDPSLRHLVVPPDRAMRRADMAHAHDRAQRLAHHAAQLADALGRAVAAWDRYRAGGAA